MKRNFYIFCFTALGALLGFLIHAIVEILVIKLLVSNWDKYALGLSFDTWMAIHWASVVILVLTGIVLGYKSGKQWWHTLYVVKKYGEPWI